jgi:membrane-bound serine protease (ClpP class)
MRSTRSLTRRTPARVAIVLAVLGASLTAPGDPQQAKSGAAPPTILSVELDDEPITPGSVAYLLRAIETAEERGVECLLLRLDTPGGLVDSTRDLVKRMLASEVPIVVHVAPDGARAASAGVFVTLAAHMAAMSEGATIGAASPVLLGGLPTGSDEDQDGGAAPSVMERKIVEDSSSWARALAARHGRSADWAERAVRESTSATGVEALEAGVIDLLAPDARSLLALIDGRSVSVQGQERRLRTRDADVQTLERSWVELFLGFVSQPNLVFLLLMLGFYALLFEFSSPGGGVAGVLGVVAILMSLFGLAALPVSALGLTLVLLALGLFVAEIFITSFGLLTAGGVVALIVGGSMLVDSPEGFLRVSLSLIVPLALASAAISLSLVGAAVRALRRAPLMGDDSLLASEARACADFAPRGERWTGRVRVHGESWRAHCATPLVEGERCLILERKGLELQVARPGDAP